MQLSRLRSLSLKSQISIAAVLVLVVLLTVTVSLTQQQQDNRSKASGADTVLYSRASYATSNTWAWTDGSSLGSIPTTYPTIYAQSDISGLTDKDHNAGVRFKYTSGGSSVLVALSGADWKIEPAGGTILGGTYAHSSSGTFRAEMTGNTVKVFWNGSLITTQTFSTNATGTGIAPSIWQSTTGVTMSNIQAGIPASAITPTSVPSPTPTSTPAPTPTPTNAPTLTPVPTVKPTATSIPVPTATKTPTPTAIALVTATPFPTSIPSATPTLGPTSAPLPTATSVPGSTVASVKLFLHGIGNGGDSVNPTSIGNTSPNHPQRTVIFEVYDVQNQLVVTKQGTLSYSAAAGDFIGNVDLGTDFNTGIYTVKMKTDKYLRGLVNGIQTITKGQVNTLPALKLVAGDINNDNQINIVDYNILIGCYSDLLPAVNCTDSNHDLSDLTDDGAVNQFDYNLFVRELTNIGGQ